MNCSDFIATLQMQIGEHIYHGTSFTAEAHCWGLWNTNKPTWTGSV